MAPILAKLASNSPGELSESTERFTMYLDRPRLLPSHNVRHATLPLYAAKSVMKPDLAVVDGLVSVTQQYWASSSQCARGFGGDAA